MKTIVLAGYVSAERGAETVMVSLAEIPFAAILAYLLLGERLTVAQMVGAVLVAAGVVVISRRRA
jgi:drug/metabolite transporter (DMT)-like permease